VAGIAASVQPTGERVQVLGEQAPLVASVALRKEISEHRALRIELIGRPTYASSYVENRSKMPGDDAARKGLLHITECDT
jgi:hypothetical protein